MKHTISILITYYRERELIQRCLDSLLAQTIPIFEILIRDDASPEPASQYVKPHPAITIFRSEKNKGPSAGRNFLLTKAKGSYLHFHDSDDWFLPEWHGRVLKELENGNIDTVFTEVQSFRDGTLNQNNVVALAKLCGPKPEALVPFALNQVLLIPSGTHRTSLVRRLGGFRESLWQSEDFEFHARLAMAEPRFRVIPESLVAIDIRGESRSQAQLEVWRCRLSALRLLFLDLSPQFYPEFIEELSAVGSKLFQLGDQNASEQAYALANELGTPSFSTRALPFRWLAKILGPNRTESLARHYRALLPSSVRKLLRSQDQSSPKRKAS